MATTITRQDEWFMDDTYLVNNRGDKWYFTVRRLAPHELERMQYLEAQPNWKYLILGMGVAEPERFIRYKITWENEEQVWVPMELIDEELCTRAIQIILKTNPEIHIGAGMVKESGFLPGDKP